MLGNQITCTYTHAWPDRVMIQVHRNDGAQWIDAISEEDISTCHNWKITDVNNEINGG